LPGIFTFPDARYTDFFGPERTGTERYVTRSVGRCYKGCHGGV